MKLGECVRSMISNFFLCDVSKLSLEYNVISFDFVILLANLSCNFRWMRYKCDLWFICTQCFKVLTWIQCNEKSSFWNQDEGLGSTLTQTMLKQNLPHNL